MGRGIQPSRPLRSICGQEMMEITPRFGVTIASNGQREAV